jgi:hypothetical protein
MPTFERSSGFLREFTKLTPDQQRLFLAAVRLLVADLAAHRPPRPALRVKRVQGTADVWEMTWAADGRATFRYGPEQRPGEAHVQWRRIGGHAIFTTP